MARLHPPKSSSGNGKSTHVEAIRETARWPQAIRERADKRDAKKGKRHP